MSLSVTPKTVHIIFIFRLNRRKVLDLTGVETNFNDFNEHPFNIHIYII